MASSSSLIAADPNSDVSITQDEFNHFHSIDRKLFLRLVVDAGCEPTQATQVMAIFLWFEKTVHDFTLVSKLLNWPDTLLTDLANEASLVYTCIENDNFPLIAGNDINDKYYDLPLTQKLTRSDVTLRFFHENRVSVKRVVTNLINNICTKAFADIVQCLQQEKAVREQVLYYNPMVQQVITCNIDLVSRVAPLQVKEESSNWRGGDGDINGGTDVYDDLAYSKEFINNELCEILSRVELSGGGIDAACERRDRDVPADDRTIFLTFSKGYPISEPEIRDFFSRYGDIIEAVYMQEVQTVKEQPLYARLVVRCDAMSMIAVILGGTRTAKFYINGKHVWARKYVRKKTKSPIFLPDSTAEPSTSIMSSLE